MAVGAGSIPAGRTSADVAQTAEHRSATPERPVRSGSSASQTRGVAEAWRAPTSRARVRILAGLPSEHGPRVPRSLCQLGTSDRATARLKIVAGRSGPVIWAQRVRVPPLAHVLGARDPAASHDRDGVPLLRAGDVAVIDSQSRERQVRLLPGAPRSAGSSAVERFGRQI